MRLSLVLSEKRKETFTWFYFYRDWNKKKNKQDNDSTTSGKNSAKADKSGPSLTFSHFLQIIPTLHSEDSLFHLRSASWEIAMINPKRTLSHKLPCSQGSQGKMLGPDRQSEGTVAVKLVSEWALALLKFRTRPQQTVSFSQSWALGLSWSIPYRKECQKVKPKIQLLVQFSLTKFNTGCIVIRNKFTFALSVKWKRWSLLCDQSNEPTAQSRAFESSATGFCQLWHLRVFSLHFFISSLKRKGFLRNLLNLQLNFLVIKRLLTIKISIEVKSRSSQ